MSETVAIFGDALLDPASGEMTRSAVVVIEDGRVTRTGARDTVAVPGDARTIDAEGLTLLPGLIDCHVHLRSRGNGRDLGETLNTPASLYVLNTVPAARRTLDAGFTSVRDAGGTPAGVKRAIERGLIDGPRMKVAVTALSQTGGHTDQHFLCGASLSANLPDLPSSVVDGVEPMRHRVREVIRAGADWIKLCTSGGVLSPNDDPHHPTLTVEEIGAACEEASAQGRKVMAHAQAAEGIKNALRGGVSTIEHGIWLDDDALEMMLDGGNALVPTLIAPLWVIRHAQAGRMPAWATEKAEIVFEDHKDSIRRAIEAGVIIAFGTDTGVGPHGSNGEEFLVLRELGLDPLACIRSATTVAAQTVGWEGEVGTLAAGAYGDVIGVPGDPLEQLELLAKPESVQLVVKGGALVKNARSVAAV
ncbi:MAG: amidohydrolase family protein [Candidatus Dormiibacterota bacterium]